MPITVIVRPVGLAEGESPARLTFDGTQRVVIGRGAGSDVRVPDATVSHRHASIRAQGADFTVVDEGSTNGTYVGGVRVAPRTSRIVRSGDLVRVGRVWLELRLEPTPATRDVAAATRELALAFVSQAMAAIGADPTLRLRVVEGRDAGAALPLGEAGRPYLIGRGPHCDLALADADCSREHAQVALREGVVHVRDLGAKNPTMLGETRVPGDREVPWRPPTMLRVGRTVLSVEDPVSLALADLERAPDEPLGAEEEVAPPVAEPARPGEARERGAVKSAGPLTVAPAAEGGASVGGSGAAGAEASPAAPVTNVAVKRASRKEPRWSLTDKLVMAAAVLVLGLSLGGLVWLLRG